MDKRAVEREVRMLKRRLASLDRKLAEEMDEKVEDKKKSEDEMLMEEIESMEKRLAENEDEEVMDMEAEDELEDSEEDALLESLEDVSKQTEEELFDYSGKSDDQVQELLDVQDKAQDIENVVDQPASQQEGLDDIQKPVLARYMEASRRLDRVAEALEAKGGKFVKFAYRIDKIADAVDREIRQIKRASRRS